MKAFKVRPSILGLAAVVAFYAWVVAPNPPRDIDELGEYCYMIEVWEQSDGQFGWAPYNGTGQCEGVQHAEHND